VKPTLLVVEDDPTTALVVAGMLSEAGCAILGPVATAHDAIALIHQHRIDGATLDVRLKGGEMVHAVIQELRSRKIPYAIVTGFPDDVASHVGGAVITKPVLPAVLRRWVAALPELRARDAS
jgi:CheY-like chemotaxis protein